MNLRTLIAAFAISVAGSGAFANADTPLGILSGSKSFASVNNDVTGPFTDTFSFALPSASSVGASLTNVSFTFGSSSQFFINSFAASLDSTPLVLSSTTVSGIYTVQVLAGGVELFAGNHSLTVTGSRDATGGSYGGNITATPVTPVPEPSTVVMLLAGLGVMGSIVRRRNRNVQH